MQRITVSLDDETAASLDQFVAGKGYDNRSEAIRDLVRDAVSRQVTTGPEAPCIGVLSYTFDHEKRDLARRLAHTHHDHHVLNLSTLHLHLDRHLCFEVAVLRGKAREIQDLANEVSTERGVRLSDLRLIADERGHE